MKSEAELIHADDLADGVVHIKLDITEDSYSNAKVFYTMLSLLDTDFPLVMAKSAAWEVPEKCDVCGGLVWTAPRLSPVEVRQIATKLGIRYESTWMSEWGCVNRRRARGVKEVVNGSCDPWPGRVGECEDAAGSGESDTVPGDSCVVGSGMAPGAEQPASTQCDSTDDEIYADWVNCAHVDM
jgi:hypothetical protein